MNARRNARDNAQIARVPLDRLRAHPLNIRTDLGDLRDLIESIRHEGVLVPLMAERRGDHLRLLHGHRRWAAAQLAGVTRVPVVIVDPHDDDEAILLMLAEDKKQPVCSRDRGRAVMDLREIHGFTWEGIAERLGVAEGTVRNWAKAYTGKEKPIRPNKPRGGGRSKPPTTNPHMIHALLERVDEGELSPADAVDELRSWLGDWEPASVGSVSASVVDLVRDHDHPTLTGEQVAARAGVNVRLVWRARKILRERGAA